MATDVMNQQLPAWQPVILVKWMATALLAMGFVFLCIGIPATLQCMSNNEHKVWYGGLRSRGDSAISVTGDAFQCFNDTSESVREGNFGSGYCTVKIQIQESMPGPVLVMYELDNFYQNYYSYGQSRSYQQTHGVSMTATQLASVCGAIDYTYIGENESRTYDPCGLVAHSFFNDSFTLVNAVGLSHALVLNETGIAWKSDLDFLFENPKDWETYRENTQDHEFLYQSYAKSKYAPAFYEKNYLEEHFIVWMRAAAFSTFKKPYGRFPDGIEVGDQPVTLVFNVSNEFNVNQFNGSKAISIHTAAALGGAGLQPVFAWLQVSLGCVAVVSALALLLQEACCPRNIKKRAQEQSLKYSRDSFLEESTTNEANHTDARANNGAASGSSLKESAGQRK